MEHDKVATVTVTYNRKEMLIENIQAILNQNYNVDTIIIVDNNSSDNTKETVFNKFPNENIKYIYLEENIGGAGGFYTGCKYAFDNGFDWIILMDDDGKPKDEYTISNLMKEIKNKNLTSNDKVMLNSLVLCNDEKLSFGLFDIKDTVQDIKMKAEKEIILNHINPFNGTLISKMLIKQIGFPNKDFFIKGDEQDYFNRALQANSYIATVIDSLYYHPVIFEENIKKIKLFGKHYNLFVEKPWKEYYRTRNYTYMYTKSKYKKASIKLLILRLFSALVCKCNKKETVKMIIKGYKDGKNETLGKKVKPM